MLFYEQPTKAWVPMDFKLIEAYQVLQDEVCPKCGQPIWLCRSEDRRMGWKIDKSICYASKATDEANWRRNNKGKSPSAGERSGWGLVEYPVAFVLPTEPAGTELPTRKDFYEAMRTENNV